MDKKIQHGGSRTGAGRPKGIDTTTINFRVPTKHKDKLKDVCRKEISKYLKKDLHNSK